MKKLSEILETSSQNKINGFVILKPGFLNHENDFLTLLKNNDWRVIQKKKTTLTQEQAEALYCMHKDKDFYNDLCKYMCSDDSLCCSCHKDCANPIKDMSTLKTKVRDKWGQDEMKNAMHSSDSIDNVSREGNIVFNNICESIFDNTDFSPEENKDAVIANELCALYAEEINAFYQYWIVSEFLTGKERPSIQQKYKEYAMDELTDHAAKLLKRMNELNINPGNLINLYNTDTIARAKYIIPNPSFSTADSLMQNINAENNAIYHYMNAIELTKDIDPTTNQLLKDILKDEEEHKSELEDFLKDIIQSE